MKVPGSHFLSAICLFLAHTALYGQAPANDNCENADEIVIANRGFDFGIFVSRKFDVEKASRQRGEKCAPELETQGNCEKTVWFKFYIPTTRNISVKLTQQDSAIPQIFAGFNLYKARDCNYTLGDLAANLAPLNKFGQSGNTCLIAGWYYIQVGCKQKAKGQLWVELQSQAQTAQDYDNYSNPADLGLVKDKYASQTLMTTCASVEEGESGAINDSSKGKSVFCTFTLPANSIYNVVRLYSSDPLKYRIFRDNINADSIKSNKPFLIHDEGSWDFINDFCASAVSNNEKYYIQFVVPNEGNAWVQVYVSNATFSADKWNTPATDDIIYTNNSFSRTKQHRYNCDGQLNKHGCKPTIPDFYSRTLINSFSGDTTYDSVDMAGYTVINAGESGTLNVVSRNNQNYAMYMYYVLYKGDITKGCNLTLLHSSYTNSFNYCITPGAYTLVTATKKLESTSMSTHVVKQTPTVLNTVHYYPKDPEHLDTIIPATRLPKYSTNINFNMTRDTTITVDTFTVHGYFIFREFYLKTPSSLSFDETSFDRAWYYIFRGRMSKGKVSLLKNYSYIPWSNSWPNESCAILDSGHYTIVSRLDTLYKTLPCVAPSSSIVISPPFICTRDTFLSPLSAYKINNNNDVLQASGNKQNLDYVFPLPYCIDCAEQKSVPSLLQFKKSFAYPNSRYTYYTFYISQNLEFRINLDYTQFELYKGSVIANPSLIKDTNNIVSPCKFGNVYCNLEGGKFYTLVTFNTQSKVKAYFTPHRISPNDFARQAYDLGHFNANSGRSSAPMPITCHTNASQSDPCFYENGLKHCLWNGPLAYIPYKDTLDMKHLYIRKNIWYTFTVDNPAHIQVKLKGNTPLTRTRLMSVYLYKGPYQQNAALALASVDSTGKSMEWLATNQRIFTTLETRLDSVAFDNIACGPNRYFVLIEDDYFQQDLAHYEYIVTVNYARKNLPNVGDQCSDAVGVSFNNLGTLQVSSNNACHTYGGSPFEDDSLDGVKSSWYKITVNNIPKFDLKLKNIAGKGLLYFNVYGGSCGGVTKVAHLGDIYSYFTLSCMGSGTYYIQAVCDRKTSSVITFEVSLLQPENPNCKAYDFRNPLAQFQLNGGCNNDTVKLKNLSTLGKDIVYSWYINGSLFSSAKEPQMLLGNSLIKPSNTIKLLVYNKSENTYDSSIVTFNPDTTTYFFRINGPDSIYCSDTAVLHVNTNFPYKINYAWTDDYSNAVNYTNQYTITRLYADRKIYVSGESDNCKFRDSTLVKLATVPDNFRDTSVCAGGGSVTYYIKQYIRVYLDGREVSDSFKITRPGKYMLYYLIGGCWQQESMNVEIDTGKILIREKDSVTVCNQSAILSYKKDQLKNRQWSTGETTQSIAVNSAGTYILTGTINSCRSVEYTVSVVIQQKFMDFLRDTTVCKNDMVRFINPVPASTIVSRNPDLDSMRMTQPLQRKLAIRKGLCVFRDSAMIDIVVPASEQHVIEYCDSGGKNPIMLDAGNADGYLWSRAGETSRSIQVTGYGKYFAVRMHKPSCYDSAYFMLHESCPFNVYIPSAFTPNNNMLNEVFGPVITGEYDHYTMTVFNRWGEILYITNDSKAWNGFYKDELVMNGVYAYMITVYDGHRRAYRFSGTFTLLY